jgi:hypothetical protein
MRILHRCAVQPVMTSIELLILFKAFKAGGPVRLLDCINEISPPI